MNYPAGNPCYSQDHHIADLQRFITNAKLSVSARSTIHVCTTFIVKFFQGIDQSLINFCCPTQSGLLMKQLT
jgi:hypothetical protein